jgi:hypothetical protein
MHTSVAHNDDVKLLTVQICIFSGELHTEGLHLVWGDALIVDALVVVIYHALGDIDTNNPFGMRCEITGYLPCVGE